MKLDCEETTGAIIGYHPYITSLSVEFVIQIQKKAAGLASEAEARCREAWAGANL